MKQRVSTFNIVYIFVLMETANAPQPSDTVCELSSHCLATEYSITYQFMTRPN